MRVKFNAVDRQKWVNYYKVYALIPARESVQKTDIVYDVQTFDALNNAIAYGKSLMKKYSGILNAKVILVEDTSSIKVYNMILEDNELNVVIK